MLKANFSSDCFVTDKCPDRLVPGIYELGRSTLKYSDMRVSKTQVQLDVWPDRVSVTRKGRNLSCIVTSSGVVKLEVDEPVELNAGDVLYLLVSMYPVKFEHELLPFSTTPISMALESTVSGTSNAKKRSRDDISAITTTESPGPALNPRNNTPNDESDSDDGVVLLAKKPKLKEDEQVNSAPTAGGHWASGLLQYLKDPSKFPNVVVAFTEELVVIKDKFPKAKLHLLVMPRMPLQNVSSLTKAHIPLIESMEKMGSDFASTWMANDGSENALKLGPPPGPKSDRVLIGFHAIPSMSQLHLHVISSDFDSPGLKTKKHWNSFCTPFFLSPSKVIQDLQASTDKLHLNKESYEAYLDGPLKCHRCSKTQQNMPTLKSHIATCSASL